jgi:hypothetical protein
MKEIVITVLKKRFDSLTESVEHDEESNFRYFPNCSESLVV